jgi:hypothetical protein
LTVKVKLGPPAVADAGLRLEMRLLMGNGTMLDAAPPGLVTVTLALPFEAIRLAGTEAVN